MDTAASLKQTVTNLFDAVRFGDHVNELEELARSAESNLETALNKLEAQTEEITNVLAAMKVEQESTLRELSQQLTGFLTTAKEQAKAKLQARARQQVEEYKNAAASEKDKALKSLEAYFASDPLPIVENVVQVRLRDGIYEASSRYDCEGGIKYDFRLASQNSKLFSEPFLFSKLGYELKVPVRFSRGLLSKSRAPGFERLDQYTLAEAEASGGKIRASFEKAENAARMKVTTSGGAGDGFVSLEYNDKAQAVNVTNDPSLMAFADLESIKKAAGELVSELKELSRRKVALLRLTTNGEQSLDVLSCREILNKVLGIMTPAYKHLLKQIGTGLPGNGTGDELNLDFIKDRLKVLGADLSGAVSLSLGLGMQLAEGPTPSR
jgi:multidrug efflux pump subunit AcrA (membrane-fusion protein)